MGTIDMALTDGAISELPRPVRRLLYALGVGVSITVGYFTFVAGPIASAQDANEVNGRRIDKVERDVADMKSDVQTVKMNQARTDQKLDDVKDSMATINEKLDRLLTRGQHRDP